MSLLSLGSVLGVVASPLPSKQVFLSPFYGCKVGMLNLVLQLARIFASETRRSYTRHGRHLLSSCL